MTCPWSDCWCRAWPPERLPAWGEHDFEELEPEGAARVFRYRYSG